MRGSLLLAVLLLLLSGAWAKSGQNEASTFTGEITDSICAREGSHAEAMRMSKDMGNNPTSCVIACVDHAGAKFVLIDSRTRKIYFLVPQDRARQFAGRKVRITGAVTKKALEIEAIAPAN